MTKTRTERGEPASVYKVGMRVFCPYLKLCGTVEEEISGRSPYAFLVYADDGLYNSYTADGRYNADVNSGDRLEILSEPLDTWWIAYGP